MSRHKGKADTAPAPAKAPIAVLDAAYSEHASAAAAAIAESWTSAEAIDVITTLGPEAPPYERGAFYKRELPLLLSILALWEGPLSAIVIDAHAWLDGDGAPGLGARLFDALERQVPIIGLAKSPLAHWEPGESDDNDLAPVEVRRGKSKRPLYVSAAGMARDKAEALVRSMHGDSRLPTLVKAADKAARRALPRA